MREQALAGEPNSVKKQRDLMFVLSHIGDALGNPNVPNLGDTKAAVEMYRRMLEVARKIQEADPADQRARSDHAIAIMRVTALLGPEEAPEKIRLLRQAIEMQEQVARVTANNLSNQADLTYSYNFLGDALQEGKQDKEAMRAYLQGLRYGEPILEKGSSTLEAALALLYRKLGILSGKNGDRATALAFARKAYDLTDPNGPKAKGRPEGFQRFFTLRGYAAMALTYAALGDKKMARDWLERSLAKYRELEKHPSYSSTYKKERALLEKTLEGLR
jgi:tetratricopeptide (TPR) repeat protein